MNPTQQIESEEITETFVEVLFPGFFMPEDSRFKVASRDPKAIADMYPNAYCIQFYDLTSKEVTVDGEKQRASGKRKNLSPKYYPGGLVLTTEDVRNMPGDHGTLVTNMECNNWPRVVLCRTRNFQPFEEGDVVL
jgi:hypothetical protein